MSRPLLYTVHIDPALPKPYEAARFVKEGFMGRAFLFSSLWAFSQRLWWQGALLLVWNLTVLYAFTSDAVSSSTLVIVDIAVHAFIGFETGDWLRARLERQGYLLADITAGDSRLRAEQRFFDRLFCAPLAS